MKELTATDVMSSPVRTVPTGTTLDEAAEIMLDEGIGSLVIVDDENRVAGILTDSDFGSSESGVPFSTFRAPTLLRRWIDEKGVEKIYQEARRRQVEEIMTKRVHTVQDDTSLRDILDVMLRRDIKHVPVLRGDEPVGMVARHDLLRVIRGRLRE